MDPRGAGLAIDDDLVSINAAAVQELCCPITVNIFETFRGGTFTCGLAPDIGNILRSTAAITIRHGQFRGLTKLYDALHDRFVLEIQTGASDDPERYFGGMFEGIDDFTGLLVAGFATSPSNKEEEGLVIKRDAAKLANDSVAAIRAVIGKNMK